MFLCRICRGRSRLFTDIECVNHVLRRISCLMNNAEEWAALSSWRPFTHRLGREWTRKSFDTRESSIHFFLYTLQVHFHIFDLLISIFIPPTLSADELFLLVATQRLDDPAHLGLARVVNVGEVRVWESKWEATSRVLRPPRLFRFARMPKLVNQHYEVTPIMNSWTLILLMQGDFLAAVDRILWIPQVYENEEGRNF